MCEHDARHPRSRTAHSVKLEPTAESVFGSPIQEMETVMLLLYFKEI